MRLFPLVILLATTALAQDFYPKDFTAPPCAPAHSCRSFDDSDLASAAFKFYGLKLDMKWVDANRPKLMEALELACHRHAACAAVPGNTYYFCDDVLSNEARPACEKLFPGEQKCRDYLETWLLGIDLKWKTFWPAAQECAKKQPPVAHSKPLQYWMSPAVLPAGFQGKVTFYAIDPETHLPVFAHFDFDNEKVYAPSNPDGLPATQYPFDYQVKFKRIQNAQGHTDLVPPSITMTAEGYAPVTFPLAAEIPKMAVKMTPARLRAGKNVVTIEAHDAKTGKPVEARVMFGDDIAGDTNKPITLEVPRGKTPEIWVTSLFNTYSDTVVAPAK